MAKIISVMWSQFKTLFVVHLILFYIFVMSGLIVCGLMLICYITVWPWNRNLYRKMVTRLAYLHWSGFTWLGQWWSNSTVTLFFDNIDDLHSVGIEHNITIMNHKYDIDWLLAWVLCERRGMLGGTKIYGKSILKLVPLIGWAWTFTESIFLKRQWEKDREIIKKDLQFLQDYPDDSCATLLLFCEGTRFTQDKLILSNEIARKKGLKELKHHLLPRTKGFVLSMQGVQGKFTAIYDLTIAFPKDENEPTFTNLLFGKPLNAKFYFRRISIDDVPTDSDEVCAKWLHKFYQEKDEIYDNFYKNGRYTIGQKYELPRRPYDLIVVTCWAILLCVPLFHYCFKMLYMGSMILRITAIVFFLAASIGMKLMIMVTQTNRGSDYGKTK